MFWVGFFQNFKTNPSLPVALLGFNIKREGMIEDHSATSPCFTKIPARSNIAPRIKPCHGRSLGMQQFLVQRCFFFGGWTVEETVLVDGISSASVVASISARITKDSTCPLKDCTCVKGRQGEGKE